MLDSLVENACEGSREAQCELWRRYRPVAFRYAMSLCHDEDRAADLVAEAFLRGQRGLSSYQGKGKFSSWICRIIAHCHYDSHRKVCGIRTTSYEQDLDEAHEPMDPDPGAQHLLEKLELRKDLADAVGQLPDAQREMVVLHYVQGEALPSIARRLQIPVGTAKSRLHRARAILRDSDLARSIS